MIRLHQTFGAHTGRVLEMDREVIRFGRLPDNEVSFDPHADLDASGRHAEIRRENGQWVLIDIGSRNGTLVRGNRVTRHVLSSGDEVEFGLGGPRMRIEIPPIAVRANAPTAAATPMPGSRPGIETAAATPIHGAFGGGPVAFTPDVGFPTPPPSPFVGATPSPAMPSPAPVDSAPPKQFGQRTVGVMIQQALQQAEQQRAQGGNRSTAFFRAMASEAAQSSSRGLKIALALITVLLLATVGGVVVLFFYERQQEQDLRDENVRLQRELGALGDGETAERQRLEQRIQTLNEELHRPEEATGRQISQANDQALYVLMTERSGRRQVLCSAFAVRADLLATNAHCVGSVERAIGERQSISVVPNRGRGSTLHIVRMWRHPMFVAEPPVPSPDVGLIRVDGTISQQVRLATPAELAELHVGDDVFVYGFPEQIAPSGAPVAVMTSGVIGRLSAFDGTETEAGRRHLVSHGAFTDEGAAGSPLFDREGRVVAINAGNYRTRTRVVDPGTRLSRTVDTETPYTWAVRADLLLQLLAGLPP